MSGKVFISCGQASEEERGVAQAIAAHLSQQGFAPYVAIQAQSIEDVNSGIVNQLKSSDYYLFIDFCREVVGKDQDNGSVFRGSLFTHQELAIAYALDFQNTIFLRQKGTELSGLAKYMLSNATEFSRPAEVVQFVRKLVRERKWYPSYSRHFVVAAFFRCKSPEQNPYPPCEQYTWLARVTNARSDFPARHTVAQLVEVLDDRGKEIELESHMRAALYWPLITYLGRIREPREMELLPGESSEFEAFAVRFGTIRSASGKDEKCDESSVLIGRFTVIKGVGVYRARYQVLADGFPPMEFVAEITVTGKATTTKGRLCN